MTLQFDGCAYFRQRLAVSTLSCTPIKIKNIRSQENQPGLRGKTISFTFCPTPSFFYFYRIRNQSITFTRKINQWK